MTRTITGLFDTRAAAEATVAHLRRHDGIPPDRIRMHGEDTATGTDDQGLWASLKSLFLPEEDRAAYSEGIRRGGVVVSAEVGEELVEHAMDVFEQNGAVDLDTREAEWRSSGWSGIAAGSAAQPPDTPYGMGLAASGAADTRNSSLERGMDTSGGMTGGLPGGLPGGSGLAASGEAERRAGGASGITGSDMTGTESAKPVAGSLTDGEVGGIAGADMARTGMAGTSEEEREVLPVVEEQLRIGKRDTERGRVRVRSYVVERPVSEQVSLRSEHVNVERRPVDREVAAGEDAFRERTIEAVEHSEEAVVSKEARVVEEVAITKDVSQREETVRDTVRRQDVKVEDSRDTGTGPMPRNPA